MTFVIVHVRAKPYWDRLHVIPVQDLERLAEVRGRGSSRRRGVVQLVGQPRGQAAERGELVALPESRLHPLVDGPELARHLLEHRGLVPDQLVEGVDAEAEAAHGPDGPARGERGLLREAGVPAAGAEPVLRTLPGCPGCRAGPRGQRS